MPVACLWAPANHLFAGSNCTVYKRLKAQSGLWGAEEPMDDLDLDFAFWWVS